MPPTNDGARVLSQPEPGYFKTRRVRGGPWLPARIEHTCHCTVNGGCHNEPHGWRDTCDRYPPLTATIDFQTVEPERVWAGAVRIDRAEYEYLVLSLAYDREHDPRSPAAQPDQPIDLDRVDPRRFSP